MAKKKASKSDNHQPSPCRNAVQQTSQQKETNRHSRQNPEEISQKDSSQKHATVCNNSDVTDICIKSIQQIGNRKRSDSFVQKSEEIKTTPLNVEDVTETDDALLLNKSISQTSFRSLNLETETRKELEEYTPTCTTDRGKNSNESDHIQITESAKLNQRQKRISDERTTPISNFQAHRQHSNIQARHFQGSHQQAVPVQVQFQHSVQTPVSVSTSKQLNQNLPIHPHIHYLHHQQQGMVNLPAIQSTCFLQHVDNQAMNNTPSTSGDFVYVQHYQQQSIINQHLQQQPQTQIHQQAPFPIIASHPNPQHIINQIPIHFPAIVANQNIIPLTAHAAQSSFITNCEYQQNQTICNPQQYQQQSNTNFPHHWQIHQKQQEQQHLHHSTQRHRPQLLFQQQKSNQRMASFFQPPIKQSNPAQQPVSFTTQQRAQPISFTPTQTPHSAIQEIPIVSQTVETEQNVSKPNNININVQLPKQQVISFEPQAVFSDTDNKTSTSNAPMGSITSTTNAISPSAMGVPLPVATNTTCNNQGVNLYVKHLDNDVDDSALKKMFSRFGEVVSAKVMMEGQTSRGFGFVCFAKAEDAARATREIRRKTHDLSLNSLYVAPAQRKEERQAFFREKLKSFMGEPAQENESSLTNVNLKERNQVTTKPSLRQSQSGVSESKGEEMNFFSSSKGEEKINVKSDFKPSTSTPSANRSSSFVQQGVVRRKIFDLDNFSLEKLTIPLIQRTNFPINTFHNATCINNESQSEPIPEWFYEADDDDDDNSKNRAEDKELQRDKTKLNSIMYFNDVNQFWPAFESPRKSCKFTNPQNENKNPLTKNKIPSAGGRNQNEEALPLKSLCAPSNPDDVQFDQGDGLPSAWNCKLITKEDSHVCKVSSTNSQASSSPESLYDCKKLVTDCIACCTDTDSAEEDDNDIQTSHFLSAQNGHNNNSNVYLSLSKKKLQGNANDEDPPRIVIEITSCARCRLANNSDERIQCNKLKSISNCNVMAAYSLEKKEKIRRKRKAACLYNHVEKLEHSPLKRRFVMPQLLLDTAMVSSQ